jgi:hypothetical protein
VFSVLVTPEQEEEIRHFMIFCEMDIELAPPQNEALHDSNETFQIEDPNEAFRIDQDPNEDECEHCFCRPCITDMRNVQEWWQNGPIEPDDHFNPGLLIFFY